MYESVDKDWVFWVGVIKYKPKVLKASFRKVVKFDKYKPVLPKKYES